MRSIAIHPADHLRDVEVTEPHESRQDGNNRGQQCDGDRHRVHGAPLYHVFPAPGRNRRQHEPLVSLLGDSVRFGLRRVEADKTATFAVEDHDGP
jgi:hypothetical protein